MHSLDPDYVLKVLSRVPFTMQIKVVPHEMGACYLTAIRHRYILDIMEEVCCSHVLLLVAVGYM